MGTTDERVAALERECSELRQQVAAAQRPPDADAAAFLESVLDSVPAFIMRIDADMRILYVNRVLPGLCMENVVGREIWDFIHADSRASARACIENVLRSSEVGTYEAISIGPDGGPAHYDSFVTPLADPSGRLGVCLVSVDVTHLRTRDVALRRSEEELRVAVEATGIALWHWTLATNEVHWYPRTYEVYGRSVPVGLQDYIEVLVHPDDRELLRANTASSIAGGSFSGPLHRIVREDGAIRWILSRGRTEVDASGNPVRMIGGSLDVTEQHEREAQLRHVQRLDAVGELTAGVAHNFNNMLTVLIGTLELLTLRLAGDDRRLVDGALESALRGSEMVRQLMTFTGQRAQPERRPHDIGPLVQQVVEMCRQTFDGHIALSCEIAAGLPAVRCTANEIEQVLMNLLVNARCAVLDAGRATAQITISVDSVADSSGARITVSDNGIGMSEDTRERAFDPFFSTKGVGKGTGLGLTTSYAIVRELDGTMTCESTAGVGTTFVVCLPGTVAVPEKSPVRAASVGTAGRRVLLIDDDAGVRGIVASLLASEGFDVHAVSTGDAGLAHLAGNPSPAVVLLDRSMPDAPGEAFVPGIRAVAPKVPIVMFTGQTVGVSIAALVDRVLVKPVTAAVLVDAIESLINPVS